MLEILLALIDRLVHLIKQRQETDRQLYEDFVVPALADFEILHQNYLDTFHGYLRDMRTARKLRPNHPVLRKIGEDSLYSEQLRARLKPLADFRSDPVFGSLIGEIVQYTQGGELGKQTLLNGDKNSNVARRYVSTGLADLFASNETEVKKQETATALLNFVIRELQLYYSSVVEEGVRLKARLLDPRVGKG